MKQAGLTLWELFDSTIRRGGDRVALSMNGKNLTYIQLDEQSSQLAHALKQRGVGPGVAVCLLLRNSLEFMIADLAIIKLGAIKVPLNELHASADLHYLINHSDARFVIAHTSFNERIKTFYQEIPQVQSWIAINDGLEMLEAFESYEEILREEPTTLPDVQSSPDDMGLIIYTGGTTGRPKGVVHKQSGLAVNLLSHLIVADIHHDEHLLVVSPLPHAAQFPAQTALLRGARVTIHDQFDVENILRTIEREKITWMFLVPTMIYRLLDHPLLKETDYSSLRTIIYGASPITSARLRQGLDVFGPIFLQLYGQSEAPNFITLLSKEDHLNPDYHGSCGQPVQLTKVRIVGENDEVLDYGQVGEVEVRSFYTLDEYYKAPDKTEETYHGEWKRTGDIGYLKPSEHLFLTDRASDMIISGGFNVYSTEVENAIQELEGVGQVVVIGIPHPDWGEAVHAFIILNDKTVTVEQLHEHCREHLARYKAPKTFEFVAEVPVTAYGKPDKKLMRAKYWEGKDRAIG